MDNHIYASVYLFLFLSIFIISIYMHMSLFKLKSVIYFSQYIICYEQCHMPFENLKMWFFNSYIIFHVWIYHNHNKFQHLPIEYLVLPIFQCYNWPYDRHSCSKSSHTFFIIFLRELLSMELMSHCNLFVNLLIEIVCQIAWKIVVGFIPIISI